MRFVLITTTDLVGGKRDAFETLRRSLAGAGADALLVAVLRGPRDAPPDDGVRTEWVRVGPMGVAAARNAGLARAERAGLLDGDVAVGFPDDDCYYPAGSLAHVAAHLRDHDFVFGCYGPADGVDPERFPAGVHAATIPLVMRAATSITTFYRGSAVGAIGGFDERFGVGARVPAGEDADYALRALAAGLRGVYARDVEVRHDYKPGNPAAYYPGGVAALGKQIGVLPGAARASASVFRHGLRLVRAGTMPAATVAAALGLAGWVRATGGPRAKPSGAGSA